jgi:hypothetical protein
MEKILFEILLKLETIRISTKTELYENYNYCVSDKGILEIDVDLSAILIIVSLNVAFSPVNTRLYNNLI